MSVNSKTSSLYNAWHVIVKLYKIICFYLTVLQEANCVHIQCTLYTSHVYYSSYTTHIERESTRSGSIFVFRGALCRMDFQVIFHKGNSTSRPKSVAVMRSKRNPLWYYVCSCSFCYFPQFECIAFFCPSGVSRCLMIFRSWIFYSAYELIM